jgi:hypothetical protein
MGKLLSCRSFPNFVCCVLMICHVVWNVERGELHFHPRQVLAQKPPTFHSQLRSILGLGLEQGWDRLKRAYRSRGLTAIAGCRLIGEAERLVSTICRSSACQSIVFLTFKIDLYTHNWAKLFGYWLEYPGSISGRVKDFFPPHNVQIGLET